MASHPHAGFHAHAPSPVGRGLRHVRQVAKRNGRLTAIAVVGMMIVIALACLALATSASR